MAIVTSRDGPRNPTARVRYLAWRRRNPDLARSYDRLSRAAQANVNTAFAAPRGGASDAVRGADAVRRESVRERSRQRRGVALRGRVMARWREEFPGQPESNYPYFANASNAELKRALEYDQEQFRYMASRKADENGQLYDSDYVNPFWYNRRTVYATAS